MVRAAWVLAVVASGVAAQSMTPLSSDEITALVSGKRVAAARPDGASVRLRFAADGGLSVQDGHAVGSDKWSVEQGKLCLRVARWRYYGCGTLARVGGTIKHFYPDGQTENLAFD